MKKKFTVKLNTQFTICFSQFGLSDEEQLGNYPTKRVLINYYLAEHGFDEFDVAEVNGNSLPQAMAEVAKAHQQYMVEHKADFEICQVCQANETNETGEISQVSRANKISQAIESNETNETSQISQECQATEICQVCQAIESNETSEVSRANEISQDKQVTQISQTNQKNQTGGISKKNAVPTNNRQPNLI